MLRPVRTSAPATTPISVSEAKAQCRVDHADEDTLFGNLVGAVTEYLDGWGGALGRCLISQNWRVDFPTWPVTGFIRLPFADVTAISSVTYYDTNGDSQTVSSALYQLYEDDLGSFVRFTDAFTAPTLDDDRMNAVSVAFVAGYGANAGDVPEPIRQAMLLMVAGWYDNRESVSAGTMTELPFAVRALLQPYRRVGV